VPLGSGGEGESDAVAGTPDAVPPAGPAHLQISTAASSATAPRIYRPC